VDTERSAVVIAKTHNLPQQNQEVSIEFKVDHAALYCSAVLEYIFVAYIKPHI
jgi:hypothetical protein